MNKLPLSVSVISFNEERIIGKMLESITGIASEIIVVDSHSTDKTREIAESYGARVFVEDWKGHIGQKNSALEKCTMEWVLMLDCDEIVSDELRNSILRALESPLKDGYRINRKTHYMGKLLNYAWQPDWNLRLVRNNSGAVWKGLNPHDKLEMQGSIGNLEGDLIHYSYTDISHHFRKTIDYARTAAESYHEAGKRFKFSKLIINPLFNCFKRYILNRGFLDGIRGFIAAFSSFVYTFMKYVFLWEIESKSRNES